MNKNSTPWKNMNKTYFIARSGIFLNEYLSIKGAILEKQALEKYLQQLALDNQLTKKSSRETYPIPRLKENFDFISQTYDILNENIRLKIPIHPAGEWLLDNYYIIEETVKGIEKELSLKKYINKTFECVSILFDFPIDRLKRIVNNFVKGNKENDRQRNSSTRNK